MNTSDKTHPSQFGFLRLTPAERGNTNLRRAAERRAVTCGYFESADEASGFFDAQTAAEDDPRVTPELREVFRENARLAARVAAQDAKSRGAWEHQQKLNSLIARHTRLLTTRAVEAAKLDFVADLKAQIKESYGAVLGRGDATPEFFCNFGSRLRGLDATADFVRSEILPQLDKDIVSAAAELKAFTAAPSPS